MFNPGNWLVENWLLASVVGGLGVFTAFFGYRWYQNQREIEELRHRYTNIVDEWNDLIDHYNEVIEERNDLADNCNEIIREWNILDDYARGLYNYSTNTRQALINAENGRQAAEANLAALENIRQELERTLFDLDSRRQMMTVTVLRTEEEPTSSNSNSINYPNLNRDETF